MKCIQTSRLTLRPFKETDGAALFGYLSNPRVNCFLDSRVDTIEQAEKEAKKRSSDGACLAVCLKETDELIGDLFLHPEDHHQEGDTPIEKAKPDTYSVGWNFNGAYEGKGYASESAYALLEYLFHQAGARRIYAYVEDDNVKSQALCERLGMRKEGCFMEFVSFVNHSDGTPKYENTFQYAILKKEWLQTAVS